MKNLLRSDFSPRRHFMRCGPVVLLAISLLGCARTIQVGRIQPPPPLQLSVRAIAGSQGGSAGVEVGPQVVLHSGDRVSFYVKLDAPGFIYLLGRSDQDPPEVLHASPWPLQGETGRFMAPLSSSIKLEDQAAVEDFVVFAARQSVPTDKLIRLTRNMRPPKVAPLSRRVKKPTPGKVPDSQTGDRGASMSDVDMGERSFAVVRDVGPDAGEAADPVLSADGISYWRLAFRHAAAPKQRRPGPAPAASKQ